MDEISHATRIAGLQAEASRLTASVAGLTAARDEAPVDSALRTHLDARLATEQRLLTAVSEALAAVTAAAPAIDATVQSYADEIEAAHPGVYDLSCCVEKPLSDSTWQLYAEARALSAATRDAYCEATFRKV